MTNYTKPAVFATIALAESREYKNIFCQCCGMQLRTTPAEKEYKKK
jgi:hypothetical protein